jgi:hypothetical protein
MNSGHYSNPTTQSLKPPYQVNKYWLDYLWDAHPIGGGADIDDNPLHNIDLNNKENVAHLVEKYIKPSFKNKTLIEQQVLKETFRYAINFFSNKDLEYSLDRCLVPFDLPKDLHAFYVNVWEILFDNEDSKIGSESDYILDNTFGKSLHDYCKYSIEKKL